MIMDPQQRFIEMFLANTDHKQPKQPQRPHFDGNQLTKSNTFEASERPASEESPGVLNVSLDTLVDFLSSRT
ncbi:MAG: hypothetical protein HUJ26_03090 [Planctomycetaceae bacterium]|nr:hypothetical protein [Planctomycetaceae bacterium]